MLKLIVSKGLEISTNTANVISLHFIALFLSSSASFIFKIKVVVELFSIQIYFMMQRFVFYRLSFVIEKLFKR